MSIASLKPFVSDPPPQAGVTRANAVAGDFGAVARELAAGDLAAARGALPVATAPISAAAATLSQSLAAGNLAAARLALVQLGADPYAGKAQPGAQQAAAALPDTRDDRGPAHGAAPCLPGSAARAAPLKHASPVDASAKLGTAAGSAQGAAAAQGGQRGAATMIADAGSLGAGTSTSYSVADVMLALATGNAGNIPADVINLYGPGGARYDPAAIMDAYRNSDIGKAQMAMFAWMSKQA